MTAAAVLGSLDSGHGCWPSRPSIEGSPTVRLNGIPALRVGDAWATHCCVVKPFPCHDGVTASGSPSVRVNGRPLARIGDSVSCGSTIVTGCSTVNANG